MTFRTYQVRLAHPGGPNTKLPMKSITGTTLPLMAVNVEFKVHLMPEGDNELIAHYLVKQACRDLIERIDREGLDRVTPGARQVAVL